MFVFKKLDFGHSCNNSADFLSAKLKERTFRAYGYFASLSMTTCSGSLKLCLACHVVGDLVDAQVVDVGGFVLLVPSYGFGYCFGYVPFWRPSKLGFGFCDVELENVCFVGSIWV